MAIKEIRHENLTWVHISKINPESLDYLQKKFKFHPLDLEDIQTDHSNPKLDVYKNYIFLIVHFPRLIQNTGKIVSEEIDMFIGDGYVITLQDAKNREMKDLFYRCANNRKIKQEWMGQSSGFLLYNILEQLFTSVQPILNILGKELFTIENEVYREETQTLQEIKKLAQHRRNTFNLRRILDPQRFVISTLSHTRRSFLDESLSIYFDDVRDRLDRLWAVVQSYKETIDGLHWTVESIINQRTNKVISMLTAVSVAFMPLTLLSGIYGMNIPLPFDHNPGLVFGMFGILIAAIAGLVYIMRRKHRI